MCFEGGGQSSSLSHTLAPSADLGGREEVFDERWQPSLFSGLQMLHAMHERERGVVVRWGRDGGGSRSPVPGAASFFL